MMNGVCVDKRLIGRIILRVQVDTSTPNVLCENSSLRGALVRKMLDEVHRQHSDRRLELGIRQDSEASGVHSAQQ